MDSQDRFYVADAGLGLVLVFTPEHRFIKTIGTKDVLTRPTHLAIDEGKQRIYVSDVKENRIVGQAFNQTETLKDPTAHAEILAITQAAAALGDWRLYGCTLYVTKEPCPMCAGALVLARLGRLIYGCDDPKAGACGTLYNIVQDDRLNHRMEVTKGILAERCSVILTEFFQNRRKQKASNAQ